MLAKWINNLRQGHMVIFIHHANPAKWINNLDKGTWSSLSIMQIPRPRGTWLNFQDPHEERRNWRQQIKHLDCIL